MFQLHIENSYKIIPCYTADVSGVCSALYERGGILVMHDPSGCNSTYNTHDETRWYREDSLICITAFTELDAVLGNDEKVIRDVSEAAERLRPRFICLCGSPIPFLIGTDYRAIAAAIERKTGISSFCVETNGMHDYIAGAGNALLAYARKCMTPLWDRLAEKKPNPSGSENSVPCGILGYTPLDFPLEKSRRSLSNALSSHGLQAADILRTNDPVLPAVNLCVSAAGLPLAKYMSERYKVPYAIGIPVDAYKDALCCQLRELAQGSIRRNAPSPEKKETAAFTLALIGEAVAMRSLAEAIRLRYGINPRVLCPLERSQDCLSEQDFIFRGEDQCRRLLQHFRHVTADPLYRPICPEGIVFHGLPHFAFSGRCFQNQFLDLMDPALFL